MFELIVDEHNSLKSQFAFLDSGRGYGSKYLFFSFAEQVVVILSSVLNSKFAIQINMMCTFVTIRNYLILQSTTFDKPQKRVEYIQGYEKRQ